VFIKFKLLKLKKAIQSYLRSIKLICPQITEAELEYIESKLDVSVISAKNFYKETNSVQNEIGFLFSGLIRVFHVDDLGNQITIRFIKENEFATHFSAFIIHNPFNYFYKCVETSIVVKMPFSHLIEGYEVYPILQCYGRLVAEEALKVHQKRIESFLFDTAEVRYINYLKEYPDLIERISISNLCTYLGIERQSLTRIRKKLTKHKM
jgi:CRP-like cAMP-binding protein